jgi:hypothetical protein
MNWQNDNKPDNEHIFLIKNGEFIWYVVSLLNPL